MSSDQTRPTWAGRLPGGLDREAWDFLHSLPHDAFLWPFDVRGTIAHVSALESAGVLDASESARLRSELEGIRGHPELIEDHDEDVHSAIERVLTERLGDLGAKVHTGRSRNDQVATALRLWAREAVADVWEAVAGLALALVHKAKGETETICPGYTHLQRAQPITVAYWLAAHAHAFERDAGRLRAAFATTNVSPLGAGALAGSTFSIDPGVAAEELSFDGAFGNAMDAVSDRDFLCDAVYATAMAAVHLSRLAEEVVLWSSSEFGFLRLPDSHATGSSMMPQKKNPDVAELARAEPGAVTGALVGLITTLKGLPLAYDRDLQADKRNLVGVLGSTAGAFRAMRGLIEGCELDADRLRAAASDDRLLATDLAEELVRKGVPFRTAHEMVGALARSASEDGASLAEAIERDPSALDPLGAEQAKALLDPGRSLHRRSTPGGPSPDSVAAQLARLSEALEASRAEARKLS